MGVRREKINVGDGCCAIIIIINQTKNKHKIVIIKCVRVTFIRIKIDSINIYELYIHGAYYVYGVLCVKCVKTRVINTFYGNDVVVKSSYMRLSL